MKIKEGYKYQLVEDFTIAIEIKGFSVVDKYIELYPDGRLIVFDGYCYDGPSGPTIDTKNSMKAALVHDALYELLRKRLLPQELREVADKIFYQICRSEGMGRVRAWAWALGLKMAKGDAALPENRKKTIEI